jgi:ATP-dependent Clp protease ATP-binding subunit ClpA
MTMTATAYEQMKVKVQTELKQHFRPEFLNRIDDVIVFHQLSEPEIFQIVDLMIAGLEKRLAEQDMAIELTPAAKKLLSERGYDPALGARPLRRVIQRDIEDSLSEKLLFGDLRQAVASSNANDEPIIDEARHRFFALKLICPRRAGRCIVRFACINPGAGFL